MKLNKGEQFIYDWQYGKLGKGSFMNNLAETIASADDNGLDKLGSSFPHGLMQSS